MGRRTWRETRFLQYTRLPAGTGALARRPGHDMAQPPRSKERRFPRFTVEGVHGKMALSTVVDVVNLSLGGMAVRADRRFNIGSECTLKLPVGERDLTVQGVVVWSSLTGVTRKGEDTVPQYSAGIRFRDMISDRLEDLIDFIDRHKIAQEHRLSGIRFLIKASGKATVNGVENYKVKLISLSGMLIEAARAFTVDETYPMEILPPNQEPIVFTGRVASVMENDLADQTTNQIGIEFLEMAPEQRRRLTTFIACLSND
jgi:c-di-GMP-binding flagellar brake protein YcgR